MEPIDEATHLAIAELRRRMRTETDFSRIFDWFVDELATRPRFLALGQRHDDPRLAAAIEALSRRIVRPDARTHGELYRIAEEGFCHGPIVVTRPSGVLLGVGIALFFEDLGMGLLQVGNVPGTSLAGMPSYLVRLSLLEVRAPAVVARGCAQA